MEFLGEIVVDGRAIMWAFGLVFAAVTLLGSIIWKQLTVRIKTAEDAGILLRVEIGSRTDLIFSKIDAVNQNITDMRGEFTDRFVTKNELDILRNGMKAGRKQT